MRQNLLLLLLIISAAGTAIYADTPAQDSDIDIQKEASSLQIPFIRNEGQIKSDEVKFYTKLFNGMVFVTDKGELVYHILYHKDYLGADDIIQPDGSIASYQSEIIRENLCTNQDNRGINIRGLNRSQAYVNYIIIDSPQDSRDNIATYNLISLGEPWPGITLNLKANSKNIEKLFIVSPEGNPESISISLDGVAALRGEHRPDVMSGREAISLNESGELVARTPKGAMNFTRPVAYQEINGMRKPVEVSYRLINPNTYGFTVGNYDKTLPLIIDPLLASTYIGGASADVSNGIARDTAGNIFIVGNSSGSYPTTAGTYQTSFTFATDAVVSKFNSDISALLASTFLGSFSFRSEYGYGIAVDSYGNVFVAGTVGTSTSSPASPATGGAYDTSFNGSWDAYVARLNNDLTATDFVFTFLGGTSTSSDDRGYGVAVDRNNNVFVCGVAGGSTFPAVGGPYPTFGGATQDGFVARFNNNLTASGYVSTFLGGTQGDVCFGITTDSSDNVIVTGGTTSPNFPTVPLVAQIGSSDVFVTKFNNALTATLYSTRFGGTLYDSGYGIAVGRANNIYVTGETNSTNFPLIPTGNSTLGGSVDAFVTKLSPSLGILNSRYLGGSGWDTGWSIAVAPFASQVYLTGYTASVNFPTYPTTPPPLDTTLGGTSDMFVTRLDNGFNLVASIYLGGAGTESTTSVGSRAGIIADGSGNPVLTSVTTSSDFPLSNPITSPYNGSVYSGAGDIFVCRITPNLQGGAAATTSALAAPTLASPGNLAQSVAVPVLLQWTAPGNAIGSVTYQVYLSTDSYPLNLIYTGLNLSFSPSLNYETSYYWYVVATDSSGRVSWTSVYQFLTEVDPLFTSGSSAGVLFGADAFTRPIGQCFIATSVYGSPSHPNVVALKNFRNKYLLTNKPGSEFVRWYYRVSPPIAEHLKHSPVQASLVKLTLTPIVYMIRYPALAIALLLLATGLLILNPVRSALKRDLKVKRI
ncbi:MAG: SBBP repeat-containing protein [Planctomycetota bacterium]